jgi:hypothetical protein
MTYKITRKAYNDFGVLKHLFFITDSHEEALEKYDQINGFDFKFFVNWDQVSEAEFVRA